MDKYSNDDRLKYLAHQLAYNHFKTSSIDIYLSQHKQTNSSPEDLYKQVFDQDELNTTNVLKDREDGSIASRNILVIGAGASYNAFKNIPLALEAQKMILDDLIISTQIPGGLYKRNDKSHQRLKTLSFYYFIRYFRKWNSELSRLDELNDEEKKLLKDKHLNEYLRKELQNKSGFLYGVGEKYELELKRSRLFRSVYRDDERVDFETSLNILANILPIAQVRGAIQKLYSAKHGPTLFYHLVAHMFKHRFIDVIINFNFDELLDQVLEEELTGFAYDKILSDGDCRLKSDVVQYDRLRQPLYIKPHGTASHKSSMRFTKDHYHELPLDMRNFLKGLLDTREEELAKKINLITVGFELKSIEFNELLRQCLDSSSQIFSFIWHDDSNDETNYEKQLLSSG